MIASTIMMLFNSAKLTAWYDDGSGIKWAKKANKEYFTFYDRVEINNYFVKSCQFHRVESYGEYGGAIYINRNSYLLVDSASFDFCFSNYGGIIYKESGGQSALKNMCVYKCHAATYTACYISVGTGISNRNSMSSTSIVHSLEPVDHQPPTDSHTVYFENGNVLLEHNNISKNHLLMCAFGILRPDGDKNIKSKMSFTSIVRNTADSRNFIYLDGKDDLSQVNYDIYSCNILINNAKDDRYGIFFITCPVVMRNTAILGNNWGKRNYYFESTGSCKLIGCAIDNAMCNVNRLQNKEEAKTNFINRLEMVATADCIAKLDSYGDATYREEITFVYVKTKPVQYNSSLSKFILITLKFGSSSLLLETGNI